MEFKRIIYSNHTNTHWFNFWTSNLGMILVCLPCISCHNLWYRLSSCTCTCQLRLIVILYITIYMVMHCALNPFLWLFKLLIFLPSLILQDGFSILHPNFSCLLFSHLKFERGGVEYWCVSLHNIRYPFLYIFYISSFLVYLYMPIEQLNYCNYKYGIYPTL